MNKANMKKIESLIRSIKQIKFQSCVLMNAGIVEEYAIDICYIKERQNRIHTEPDHITSVLNRLNQLQNA